MEMHRIYLATPYTHKDATVRERRFALVSQYAAGLFREGYNVFSPITYGHTINDFGKLPHDFDFWREHCLSFIRHWADRVVVLMLPGWEKSKGVAAEIAEARALGLPVTCVRLDVDVTAVTAAILVPEVES